MHIKIHASAGFRSLIEGSEVFCAGWVRIRRLAVQKRAFIWCVFDSPKILTMLSGALLRHGEAFWCVLQL
jgi:hypothetical protein